MDTIPRPTNYWARPKIACVVEFEEQDRLSTCIRSAPDLITVSRIFPTSTNCALKVHFLSKRAEVL